MSAFVESLRRLYAAKRVTLEKVRSYYEAGKISEEAFVYITGENP